MSLSGIRATIVLGILLLQGLPFLGASPAAAATVLDQAFEGATQINKDRNVWQSVTVSGNVVTRVDLQLYRGPACSDPRPYRLVISSTNSPSAGDLTMVDGLKGEYGGGSGAWVTATFSPFTAPPSKVIYLHLLYGPQGPSYDCDSHIFLADWNGYAGGQFYQWSDHDMNFRVYTESAVNAPPHAPETPAGSVTVAKGSANTYRMSATDPDGDQTKLTVSWGDGSETPTRFYPSGTAVDMTHTWNAAGTYCVKSRAEDTFGQAGPHSTCLQVSVYDRSPTASSGTPSTPERETCPQQAKVIVWEHAFRGACAAIDRDQALLNVGFGVTSLEVQAGYRAHVHTERDFQGASVSVQGDRTFCTYTTGCETDWNDRLQSLRIEAIPAAGTNQPPTRPTGPDPSGGQQNVAVRSVAKWSGGDDVDGGAVSYTLHLGLDFYAIHAVTHCSNLPTKACELGRLNSGSWYYWYVAACDAYGCTYGDIWSFKTAAEGPPTAASWVVPKDGQGGYPGDVDGSWTGGEDPEGDRVWHHVKLGTSNPPPDLPGCQALAASPCDFPPLAHDTTYYWKVVSCDASQWCRTDNPVWSFRTGPNTRPGAPSVECAPATPRSGEAVSCTLSTRDDSGGVYYTVDWGDGGPSQRVPASGFVAAAARTAATHAYAREGAKTLRITATDNGAPSLTSDATTRAQAVLNRPPVMTKLACSPNNSQTFQTVGCTVSASDDSAGVAFLIQWGDGSPPQRYPAEGHVPPGEERAPTHAWTRSGAKVVEATAVDDASPPQRSGPMTFSQQVTNQAPGVPTVQCAPNPPTTYEEATCSFIAWDDSAAVYYEVDWGDGASKTRVPSQGMVAPSSPRSANHTWREPGPKAVTVTVRDDEGLAKTGTTSIPVMARSPVLSESFASPLDGDVWKAGRRALAGLNEWGARSGAMLQPEGGELRIEADGSGSRLLAVHAFRLGHGTVTFRAKYVGSEGADAAVVVSGAPSLAETTIDPLRFDFGQNRISATYQTFTLVVKQDGRSIELRKEGGLIQSGYLPVDAKWAYWSVSGDGGALFLDDVHVAPYAALNQPPVACLEVAERDFRDGGFTVDGDASCSRDPESGPMTYRWEWGEGGAGRTVKDSHRYAKCQARFVDLYVYDETGVGTGRDVRVGAGQHDSDGLLDCEESSLGTDAFDDDTDDDLLDDLEEVRGFKTDPKLWTGDADAWSDFSDFDHVRENDIPIVLAWRPMDRDYTKGACLQVADASDVVVAAVYTKEAAAHEWVRTVPLAIQNRTFDPDPYPYTCVQYAPAESTVREFAIEFKDTGAMVIRAEGRVQGPGVEVLDLAKVLDYGLCLLPGPAGSAYTAYKMYEASVDGRPVHAMRGAVELQRDVAKRGLKVSGVAVTGGARLLFAPGIGCAMDVALAYLYPSEDAMNRHTEYTVADVAIRGDSATLDEFEYQVPTLVEPVRKAYLHRGGAAFDAVVEVDGSSRKIWRGFGYNYLTERYAYECYWVLHFDCSWVDDENEWHVRIDHVLRYGAWSVHGTRDGRGTNVVFEKTMADGLHWTVTMFGKTIVDVELRRGATDPAPNSPPREPSDPSPASMATVAGPAPLLKWEGGDDDVGDEVVYTVFLGTTPVSLRAVCRTVTVAECRVSGLAYATQYLWRVAAVDVAGDVRWGEQWTFATAPDPNHPPDKASAPQPFEAAKGIPTSPRLAWSGSDPDGDRLRYTVYLGTTPMPTFRACVQVDETTCMAEDLGFATEYFWRVDSMDPSGQVTTGDVWSFTTRPDLNLPPEAPHNPVPANGHVGASPSPYLRWTASDPEGDLLRFTVYVGTDPTRLTPLCADTTAASCQAGALAEGAVYYWRVEASDGHARTLGDLWSFVPGAATLNHAPAAPSDPRPADGAEGAATSVRLGWRQVDPDGDALSATVHLGPDAAHLGLACSESFEESCDVSSLSPSSSYVWRVRLTDARGGVTDGPLWGFATRQNLPPVAPSQPWPPQGAHDTPRRLQLTWQATDPEGAPLSFDVRFGTSSPPRDARCSGSAAASCEVADLEYGQTYYWQVEAIDDVGGRILGPVWSFVTWLESAFPRRYEGEDQSRSVDECTPGDAETVKEWPYVGASGGAVLAYPESGCWAEWDVNLEAASTLVLRAGTTGAGECAYWLVSVSGTSLAGRTVEQCSTWQLESLTAQTDGRPLVIPAGHQTIRVTPQRTSGVTYANFMLDYLEVER